MKRLAPFILVLLVLPSIAAAATGGSHDEITRLNRADVALAKRAAVHKSDLLPTWRLLYSGRPDDSGPPCSFDPDLSAFVITGDRETVFEHGATGSRLVSGITVFRSVRDAVGDFNAQAKPAFMRCMRTMMVQAFRKSHYRTRITSSRMLAPPKIGAQSVSFRLAARISPTAGGSGGTVYSDFLAFRQGRSQAVLWSMSPVRPLQGQLELARVVQRRMR